MKLKPGSCGAFTFYELMIITAILGVMAVLVFSPQLQRLGRGRVCSYRSSCVNNLKQMGVAFRLTQGDVVVGGGIYLVSLEATNGGAPNALDLQSTVDGGTSPYTYQIFGIMSNELNTAKLVVCPQDERSFHTNLSTVLNNGGSDPSQLANQYVSYFVGRDVHEDRPQMIQCGDRNIGTSGAGPNSAYGFSKAPGDNAGYCKEFGTNALSGTAQWTTKMHDKSGNVLFADGHVESLSSAKLRDALKVSGDPKGTATQGNFLLFP